MRLIRWLLSDDRSSQNEEIALGLGYLALLGLFVAGMTWWRS